MASRAAYTYLDHAATTPMRRQAVDAMLPFLSERFANPSGSHRFARRRGERLTKPVMSLLMSSVVVQARSCSPAAVPKPITPPSSDQLPDAAERRSARRRNTTPFSSVCTASVVTSSA